jgi:hypothetical protein
MLVVPDFELYYYSIAGGSGNLRAVTDCCFFIIDKVKYCFIRSGVLKNILFYKVLIQNMYCTELYRFESTQSIGMLLSVVFC